jgi:hypothetical protein
MLLSIKKQFPFFEIALKLFSIFNENKLHFVRYKILLTSQLQRAMNR